MDWFQGVLSQLRFDFASLASRNLLPFDPSVTADLASGEEGGILIG